MSGFVRKDRVVRVLRAARGVISDEIHADGAETNPNLLALADAHTRIAALLRDLESRDVAIPDTSPNKLRQRSGSGKCASPESEGCNGRGSA